MAIVGSMMGVESVRDVRDGVLWANNCDRLDRRELAFVGDWTERIDSWDLARCIRGLTRTEGAKTSLRLALEALSASVGFSGRRSSSGSSGMVLCSTALSM